MLQKNTHRYFPFLSLLALFFIVTLLLAIAIFGIANINTAYTASFFRSMPMATSDFFQLSLLSMNAKLYLISFFLALIAIGYLANEKIFLEVIKDWRWLRLAHYALMLTLGIVIAAKHSVPTASLLGSKLLIVNLLLAIISIMLAALFCIVTNNIIDQDIDRLSNQSRPLITGSIPFNTYLTIGIVAAFLALVYAAAININALLIIMTIIVTYSLYSLPPLRLKRIPVLSKLVISSNSLAIISLGYLLLSHNLQQFPFVLVPLFLIGCTLSMNFVDLKDISGDRSAGIKTIPVLLGPKNAALIIGVAFFLTYLSFYFLIKEIVVLPFLVGFGAWQFFCINTKTYDERHVFLIYISSMMSLILWIALSQ